MCFLVILRIAFNPESSSFCGFFVVTHFTRSVLFSTNIPVRCVQLSCIKCSCLRIVERVLSHSFVPLHVHFAILRDLVLSFDSLDLRSVPNHSRHGGAHIQLLWLPWSQRAQRVIGTDFFHDFHATLPQVLTSPTLVRCHTTGSATMRKM